MRRSLLVRVLVVALGGATGACGSRATQPAWPKLHGDGSDGSDGGESLAPHVRGEIAAPSLEDDPRPAPVAAEVPIAPLITPPADATPATVVAPEDTPPLQVEDTVIEIKDDGE